MSDSVRLQIRGGPELHAFFDGLADRLDDLTPLMAAIGTQLESSTADNFAGAHDPFGIPWPKSQRAEATGGKTLTDSRRLAGSITYRADSASVEVGTNVIYARRHNQGWTGTEAVAAHKRTMSTVFGIRLAEPKDVLIKAFARKANTPKRQFLGMGIGDEQDIVGIAQDYLEGGI